MRLPTASSLDRADICPGSEALPHVERLREWAKHGQDLHAFLERVPAIGREKALAEIESDELRAVCEEIDLSRLPVDGASYAHEVAFAFDVETGKAREIGRGLKRAYGKLSLTEIAGTADVVALEADDGVYIGDYKTGWQYEKTAPALEKNRQFRFLAKAASSAWGRSAATIEVIRLNDEGRPWKKSHGLGPFDLDHEGDELRRIALRIFDEREKVAAGKLPTLVSGAHCTYCPAFNSCPEIRGQVRAVLDAGSAEAIAAVLTDDTARMLAERIPLVEAAADRAKEALKMYATNKPVTLRNGFVYGPVEATIREIDGAKARAVLTRFLGDEKAAANLPIKTSQDAIKDLIRPTVKMSGGKLGATLDSLMEEIANVGGIKVIHRVDVKAHRAKVG